MELKLIKLLFCISFVYNIKAYVLKNHFMFLSRAKWAHNKKGIKLNLKINDVINFKNNKELKQEIIKHSKRLSLDLNDEQIKNIGNNLYEFFSYLKLRDIKIGLRRRRSKRNAKPLPLRETDKTYEEFNTRNVRKDGDYFVVDSNSFFQ
ncbi:conserved Plasmodium protein, unknown function [Plasmodium malariae]|uniref:Uncharacterized protein n=1 Tax=Plasmodium malariae TaxID=5858 RepID=A0A1D3JI92_PLAMA|nr:conserved Plasmodium protein, unknown function [Plasmodium malariae]SBT86180.1 conserved Plasmodium protein, unknown function [Plasmodium malariae]